MNSVLTKEFLQSIAHHPGVYQMKDKGEKILYVGKAKDLRKRLSSYAHVKGRHSKTAVLLSHIASIETILTHTEKEALILEASLIKKYRPKYNVILRDDKNYPLIKVTVKEKWPRVMMTRRRIKDGSRYFGPYSATSSMWSTLKLLHSFFPLRRCKGKTVKRRTRPCLDQQMGHCFAPCCSRADHDKYLQMVRNVVMVLEGHKRKVIDVLIGSMEKASLDLRFEEAAQFRDQIQALEKTLEKQIVVASHERDQDVFGFVRKGAAIGIAIIHVRNGRVSGQRNFFLAESIGEDKRLLGQILHQYYSENYDIPGEILLPFKPENQVLLVERFAELKEAKVDVRVPRRGNLKKLIDLAKKNSEQILEDREKKLKSWQQLSKALQDTLHLSRLPERMECLDISNLGGEQAVGALVCFSGGEKDDKNYRHYKIKTLAGPDDYGMMAEVLQRRLSRGIEEGTLPDLLIVDGGKGQLNVAVHILGSLQLSGQIDLVGIAKEKQEEGEKLYIPGRKNPIFLPRHSPVLLLLMRIRDESHRYGITFHRKWRRKDTLLSELDSISGLGALRKKSLLKALGSLKRVKEATLQDLLCVEGVGPELAKRIWSRFHE